jgi:hypothetical protein
MVRSLQPFLAGSALVDAGKLLALEGFPPAIRHPAHAEDTWAVGRRMQDAKKKLRYLSVLTVSCQA